MIQFFMVHMLLNGKGIFKKLQHLLNITKNGCGPAGCYTSQVDRIYLKSFKIIFLGHKLLHANTILRKMVVALSRPSGRPNMAENFQRS